MHAVKPTIDSYDALGVTEGHCRPQVLAWAGRRLCVRIFGCCDLHTSKHPICGLVLALAFGSWNGFVRMFSHASDPCGRLEPAT